MLRLAFDFIIAWRETRTRPNAYIILYINFWRLRFIEAKRSLYTIGDVYGFKLVLLFIGFFIIESTSDTTFTHNRGMYMLIMLTLVLKDLQTRRNDVK